MLCLHAKCLHSSRGKYLLITSCCDSVLQMRRMGHVTLEGEMGNKYKVLFGDTESYWGERLSELMIKKKITRHCTQYCLTWVFLPFVHVVF